MSREPLSGFQTLDIGYPIESDRQTASDKLYITQLLPTKYPIIVTNTSGFPTSDIGYLIELDRWTTSDKLYITQLLPTEYSINITNRFGGYQYNKQ